MITIKTKDTILFKFWQRAYIAAIRRGETNPKRVADDAVGDMRASWKLSEGNDRLTPHG